MNSWILGFVLVLTSAAAASATKQIDLPVGAQTEGITAAAGNAFFAGDIRSGAVFLVDVRSGLVTTAVPPAANRISVGIDAFDGKLFVAGGGTPSPVMPPNLRVYDIPTGSNLASCNLTDGGFINDVVVDDDFAYFTDSFRPLLYRLSLKNVTACNIKKIHLPLPAFKKEDGVFRSNGIAKYRGGLIVANSAEASLFFIDLGKGGKVSVVAPRGKFVAPDGIDIVGGRGMANLYVTQNRLQLVSEWKLRMNRSRKVSAVLVRNITSSAFDFPTTVVVVGSTLAVANGRFDAANPQGPVPEGFVTTVGVTHI